MLLNEWLVFLLYPVFQRDDGLLFFQGYFSLNTDYKKWQNFQKDFFELGISKAKTPFGNEVFIYNPERTVCDMIRSRSQIEIQIFQDAMKQYIRVYFFDIKLLTVFD